MQQQVPPIKPVPSIHQSPPPKQQEQLEVKVRTIEKDDKAKNAGLRDKLGFDRSEKKPVSSAKKPVDKQESLIVTMAPTVLASLIVAWSQNRFPEEYQPCAPKREEVQLVINPLLAILARRIDVVGEVNQDMLDITNSILCAMTYGIRAYVTYVEIKKSIERGEYEQKQRTANPGATGNSQKSSDRTAVTGDRNGNIGAGRQPVTSVNGSNSSYGSTELPGSEADVLTAMLARDKQGRERLGHV